MKNVFKENLIRLDEIDSTNLEAFRQGKPCAVAAEYQTKGRGRLGREFVSEKSRGLWLSVLETSVLSPQLTARTGVVVCRVLRSYGLDCRIKWPNDIQVNGKKICGILCERRADMVVIGIGINLYQEDFKELSETATSAKLCGINIDKDELLLKILDGLDEMLSSYDVSKEEYLEYYRTYCSTTNKDINIIRGNVKTEAFAVGIDDEFRLSARLSDGSILPLDSGEVSVRTK